MHFTVEICIIVLKIIMEWVIMVVLLILNLLNEAYIGGITWVNPLAIIEAKDYNHPVGAGL